MKIGAPEFLTVMRDFDFLSFPRAVGNPYQDIVLNPHGLWNFVKMNNAVRICFTSHNSYPGWDGTQDPTHVRIGKYFTDFDHKRKPENALRDVRRLASFSEKENLPWGTTFSGSKGFHLYGFLKRYNYEINQELWDSVIALHAWLRYKGDKGRIPTYKSDGTLKAKGRPWLKTLDGKVAEPKRLCRIPFTRHVGMSDEREYKISPRYCIALTPEQLHDSDIDQIIELSERPEIIDRRHYYVQGGRKIDLTEFLDEFSIDVRYWCSIGKDEGIYGVKGFVPVEYNGIPDDDYAVYLSKLITRPCIHGDLFTENPSHFSRFLAVIQLKQAGFSYEEVVEEFVNMSRKFHWADIKNRKTMYYQIKQIYFKRTGVGGYWHASCKKIKSKKLCIGNKCPEWFKTEDDINA